MIKEFKTITNRRPQDMIMVDNLVYSYAADMPNGVPIKPYLKGVEDFELGYLADMLEGVNQSTDLVEFLKEKFNFDKLYSIF